MCNILCGLSTPFRVMTSPYWSSCSHSFDTPHSVGLLWMSDQPVTDTSTRKHTTLTKHRRPFPMRDSNPQYQQASDRRPKRYTARPMGSAESANGRFIRWHISSLNENNRKRIIADSKLLSKVKSSSLLWGKLRDPDVLIVTADTFYLLQRESETYSEISHKKLGQSASVTARCIEADLHAVSCSLWHQRTLWTASDVHGIRALFLLFVSTE
jgi:hypothetical protein